MDRLDILIHAITIESTLKHFESVLDSRDIGFDETKIRPLYILFKKELNSQLKAIKSEARKKPKPRSAKKILEDIVSKERVTPELLDEAKEAL